MKAQFSRENGLKSNDFPNKSHILKEKIEEALADLKIAWNESLKAEEKFKAILDDYM